MLRFMTMPPVHQSALLPRIICDSLSTISKKNQMTIRTTTSMRLRSISLRKAGQIPALSPNFGVP